MIEDLKSLGHRVFAGALGGFVCGLLVGGVGGRLAMMLLRVTTGPEVIGLESDDGFTMGTFSFATVFLLGLTAVLGAAVGVFYVVARNWLPEKYRALCAAVLLGLLVGAAIVRPGGVDFTRLSPLPLAVALFVLIPALYGLTMSNLVDRLLARPQGNVLPWLGLGSGAFGAVVFGSTGIAGLVLVVLMVLAFLGLRRFPQLRKLPSHPAVVWVARGTMVLAGVYGAFNLATDVAKIL